MKSGMCWDKMRRPRKAKPPFSLMLSPERTSLQLLAYDTLYRKASRIVILIFKQPWILAHPQKLDQAVDPGVSKYATFNEHRKYYLL